MHSHGVGFQVIAGEDEIYASDTWVDPPAVVFAEPRKIAAGTSVSFSCSYINASPKVVNAGQSIEDDEMCIFLGGYVSRSGDGAQLTCKSGSGCLTCFEGIINQDPDSVCTDDGPPSSKDAYDAIQACTCGEGPDTCAAECGDTACAGQAPSDACGTCLETKCAAQADACGL